MRFNRDSYVCKWPARMTAPPYGEARARLGVAGRRSQDRLRAERWALPRTVMVLTSADVSFRPRADSLVPYCGHSLKRAIST